MFITDRDLLVLEPGLFRDFAWTGQRLIRGTADTDGNDVVISASDPKLSEVELPAGAVIVVGAVGYEVLGVPGSDRASACPVRASTDDPPNPLPPMSDAPFYVATFTPQIRAAHRQILAMAGIDADSPAPEGRPGEDAITNGPALAPMEAFGALYLIFSGAGALAPDDAPANRRAQAYRERYAEARRAATIELDLDADGLPDAARRLNLVQFLRG